jgi:hypothetical protein
MPSELTLVDAVRQVSGEVVWNVVIVSGEVVWNTYAQYLVRMGDRLSSGWGVVDDDIGIRLVRREPTDEKKTSKAAIMAWDEQAQLGNT